MMRLKSQLDSHDEVVSVWFNAWTAEGKDVLEGLIKSVLNRIDANVLRKALRRKRLMSAVRIAISVVADLLRLRNVADEIWHQMQLNVETRNEIQGLMRSAMSDWMAKDSGVGNRVLTVFIDDLDRCSPGNVLQVFEAIKLYLDVPGFVFIIGYDKQIVSETILRQLGYGEDVKAVEYLEKIVQFAYSISPPTDQGSRNLISDYLEQAQVGSLVGESERNFLIERSGRNPRRIKRFINNFVLAYQLDLEWHDIGAQNLVQALILQMYYPEAVSAIWQRRGSDLFQECIDFVEARRSLKSPELDSSDWALVERVFQTYNLDTATMNKDIPSETLRILQDEIPTIVLKSANDPEFVTLARNIGTGENRQRLLQKLELRWQAPPVITSESGSPPTDSSHTGGSTGIATIYISYRRDDAAHAAGRIAEELENEFGTERVFLDVDSIMPGEDFVDTMRKGLSQASVVLVLIGSSWLSSTDSAGARRIDNPDDFIRLELESALSRGQRLLPVLLDDATMPSTEDLPHSLAGLVRRNAVSISTQRFSSDMRRLSDLISRLIESND
jgi:hypothetical protein